MPKLATNLTMHINEVAFPDRFQAAAKAGFKGVADDPGRHQPGAGEINYPFLFRFIDKLGYQGWIGCECMPAGATTDGLGWTKPNL
jgi:hydroxypyruvate isomerase